MPSVALTSEGKLRKYLGEIALGQPFVKDDKQVVGEVLKRAKCEGSFATKSAPHRGAEDFAAEVMAQVQEAEPQPARAWATDGTPREQGFLMAPRRR